MIDTDRTLSVLGVDISTLSSGSHKKVFKICEECGRYSLSEYRDAITKFLCNRCACIKKGEERKIPSPKKEYLVEQYLNKRVSVKDLKDIHGVTAKVVKRWLVEADIPIRNNSEAQTGLQVGEKNYAWIKPLEIEQLEKLYINDKKSAAQIGKIFGCSDGTVLRWLRDYNIPIRTISECRSGKLLSQAHKDAIKRSSPHLSGSDHPLYGRRGKDAVWYGHHHTEETKKRLREARLNQKMPTKDTEIEKRFNDALRKHGYDIITQKKCCGVCIPDFLFPDRRIAVFCDGDYWHNLPGRPEKDQHINETLLKNGWIPVRFWEHEINDDINDCFHRFELNYWGGEC